MDQIQGDAPGKLSAKRAERLERILNAAEQCFAESGFHGASIGSIAKACGMSVGHLYHYVENKEALIEEVIRRELGRHMQRLTELESAEPGDLVDELVAKVAETILHETDLFRTVLNFETLAEAQRNPKVAEVLQEFDGRMRLRFSEILRRSGVPHPEQKTELIFTIFGGLPARALRHPEQERTIITDTIVPVMRRILSDRTTD
ncbi:TetR/AcrR family transcriptional regulator [Hyphomonas sp.]|uniref:TetR/AcrR family transcriptional regulator n=1 Tax=Hyphomonas sp. TaxID=87 RepID=UPI00391880AB